MGRSVKRYPAQTELGHRVRSKRLERGWSQMELAERIGIHFTFVSSVERGEQNVSLHSLLKLADGLDLNPAVLVNQTFSSPICQSSVECGGSYSVTQGPLRNSI
jgi:transcriptional regulator with XRE-family HTH domain